MKYIYIVSLKQRHMWSRKVVNKQRMPNKNLPLHINLLEVELSTCLNILVDIRHPFRIWTFPDNQLYFLSLLPTFERLLYFSKYTKTYFSDSVKRVLFFTQCSLCSIFFPLILNIWYQDRIKIQLLSWHLLKAHCSF